MSEPVTTSLESWFTHDPNRLKHFGCEAVDDDGPIHSACGAPVLGIEPPPDAKPCKPCVELWATVRPDEILCEEHR